MKKIDVSRSLNTTSILNMFNVLEDSDRTRLLNIFKSYIVSNNIRNSDNLFQYYQVQLDDWFDGISEKFYHTSHLWWIIAVFNEVQNPFESLEEGIIIKVLRYEYIYLIFNDMISIGSL